MTLPILGAAIKHADLDTLEPWLRAHNRAIEIQDFVFPEVLAGDTAPLIDAYRARLQGYGGEIGIHGPFFGLDLSNPDAEMRAVIQRRLLQGVEIAEALGGSHMVVHSPFTYWHVLNYSNYGYLRRALFDAAADCLAPVLERAAEAGVTLMLENIDDTNPADRVDLVREIDHPSLAVSLDTGHAELAHGRYGAPPVVDFIDAAGASLGHVHLQDADGHADRHWHPGEGRLPWGPIFDALGMLEQRPRLILEVRSNLARLPQSVARLEARGLAM